MEAESTRAQKIARQIQRDMSEILQKEASALARGTMVSVTVVRMSPDLSLAKIYLRVFPLDKHAEILENIKKNAWSLRMSLAKGMKNQIKSIPEVAFFLDDSMEYADNIDSILKRSL